METHLIMMGIFLVTYYLNDNLLYIGKWQFFEVLIDTY